VDRRSGKLRRVATVDAGANPSFLAIHPNGRVLYAVNELEKYKGRPTGAVSAFAIARSVTRPVQGLVTSARGIARGNFDVNISAPSDPDLGLLVTTFRDMAQSIRRQQNDLRHERDRLQTLLDRLLRLSVHFERNVVKGRRRHLRPEQFLIVRVRKFEERQRAPVCQFEKQVAVDSLRAKQLVDLAPRRDERQPDDVLVECPRGLEVPRDIRGVVKA